MPEKKGWRFEVHKMSDRTWYTSQEIYATEQEARNAAKEALKYKDVNRAVLIDPEGKRKSVEDFGCGC